MTVNTAQATINAADYFMIWQRIEAWRISRLGWGRASPQPITIGFWTMHHRAGTYSVTVRNATVDRGYAATYTQAVADVPQYQVITIPGCPDGVWNLDNNVGITLTFAFAMGSNNIASAANTWIATPCAAAPGQINGVAATTDIFRITGVVVLPGVESPTAARSALIMRPLDQELITCKRYYRGVIPEGAGTNNTAAQAWFTVRHDGMRAAPTASVSAPVTISDVTTANFTQSVGQVTVFANSPDWGHYSFSNFSGIGVNKLLVVRSGGYLVLDARL
jgi:hypothetical protein